VNDSKKIEKTDIVQILGLILLGIGLFLFQGIGVALTVVGALLFMIGFLPGFIMGLPTGKK